MQNVPKDTGADESRLEKVNVQHDIGNIISTTPQSSSSTPSKSESETYSKNRRFMSESSESEEDSVSEVRIEPYSTFFLPLSKSVWAMGINELLTNKRHLVKFPSVVRLYFYVLSRYLKSLH